MTREIAVDLDFLRRFEAGLDPLHPERSAIPAHILGYGEISTVLACEAGDPSLAYKRMPLFNSAAEAAAYVDLYADYTAVLADAGIDVAPGQMVWIPAANGRGAVIYLAQEKLPAQSIAHKALPYLKPPQALDLLTAVFDELDKVFRFNAAHRGEVEVGFDGQLSNWAIAGFEAQDGRLPQPLRLTYFDTSSPLLRRQGVEQLNAEIFLRSAPFFLIWLLKRLYLEEVVTRYYDLRQVVIDLLANLYKEQRPELIPDLVAMCNERWADGGQGNGRFPTITPSEVAAYYRQDAFIWRLYLGARRLDRTLHRLLRRPYPHILPGKIRR
ncbi:MAG: hypothetical protein KC441_18165 [Anaerolineales bacterium]|nr:hypothetical protein [Anaerolineales bacterium]